MNTIEKVTKKIINLEKKHSMFNLHYKGYAVWPYYRMYFYYTYAKRIGLLDSSTSRMKFSFWYLFKIFNFTHLLKKSKYLILEHPRSNEEQVDIYTKDIVTYLGRENCSFFSFSQTGTINKKSDVVVLDSIKIFSKILSRYFYFFIKDMYFENNFKKFLIDLNMNESNFMIQYKKYYFEFIIQFHFYSFLLKIKNIKKVIVTVYYYNLPLVIAAKKLNIEVVEVQHGVISKYHLGYHFPYYETNFFPDKTITFGQYWNNVASFPRNTKLIELGNNFLFTEKKKMNKKHNTILIISQGTIGKKLEEYLLKNLDTIKQYTIYFKLHPSEFNDINLKYERLKKLKNITLITNEQSINDLQSFCEYQIGIYSTAIYEGLENCCKTILLDDTGVEYMSDLIEKKIVSLVNYSTDLNFALHKAIEPMNVEFFEKLNPKFFKEL